MTPRFAGKTIITATFLLALPSLALAQRPNKMFTPGAKTKANDTQVCAADYASSVKPVASWQKTEALSRYGRNAHDFNGELDHLIPVALGGSNDPDNLWPIPDNKDYGPTAKKELEDKLQQMVCGKTIALKDAQDAIKKDWVAAYDRYVRNPNAQ